MTETPTAKPANGNQRGEESRQRMIEAGLDVFGRYGFDGASTRMLAERANVNLAAIPYHFGSKEGLYRAVAEHIAAGIRDRQAPVAERIREAMSAGLSHEQALALLHEMLESFGRMIVAPGEAERWARFIVREQMDPTPAFDVLYDTVMGNLVAIASSLVGRILDRPADDEETQIRTFTIVGQILVFRMARAAILRRLGREELSPADVDHIHAIVHQHTTAILGSAPMTSRPDGPSPDGHSPIGHSKGNTT